MFKEEAQKITECRDIFFQKYSKNIDRGKYSIDFTNCLNQWDDSIVNQRSQAGKESITLGIIKKSLSKLKSQYDQINFSMDLSESESLEYTQEEIASHKMLFNHFCLSGKFQKKLADTWKKGCDFGYTFIEVSFDRENDNTLNYVPILRYKEDPSIGYWANDFEKKTRIDASYAGYSFTNMKDEELESKLSKKMLNKISLNGANEVTYHWKRIKEPAIYYCMEGGEYKRSDLIDFSDEEELSKLERDDLGLFITKKGTKFCVYFSLIVNKEFLIKDDYWPGSYLPLPYWYGFTEWRKDDPSNGIGSGYFTQPFSFILQGAQRVHNYLWSTVATIAKSYSGPRLIGNKNHVVTPSEQRAGSNINRSEGLIILGSGSQDGSQTVPLQPLPQAEIPQSLISLIQLSSDEMKDIIGMFMDVEASDTTVVSGVALDKITKNMQISSTNSELIGAHIDFINDVCLIIKEMIPLIITNRRKVFIEQPNNKVKEIIVNDVIPGTLKKVNDLTKLDCCYSFKISASPTEEMANKNSIDSMVAFFNMPQTPDFQSVKHLVAEQLPISKKSEFIKLIMTNQDPLVIAYAEDKINYDQLMQQRQMMAQQQNQAQIAIQEEQLRSQRIFADAEKEKSSAIQYNEETKRMKALGELQNDNNKLQVDIIKYGGEHQLKVAEHMINFGQYKIDASQKAAEQYQLSEEQNDKASSNTNQ